MRICFLLVNHLSLSERGEGGFLAYALRRRKEGFMLNGVRDGSQGDL